MTKVFVEQPLASPGSAKYDIRYTSIFGANIINKSAEQAAGANLYQYNSTNRQIHPFSKIAVTFEPMMQFLYFHYLEKVWFWLHSKAVRA